MKKIIATAIFLSTSLSMAQAKPDIICNAVLPGAVNYFDTKTSLSRVDKIEISQGLPGEGGDGIVAKLIGTVGTGHIAGSQELNLKWGSSLSTDDRLAEEMTYSNLALNVDRTYDNPQVRIKLISTLKKPTNTTALLEIIGIKDAKEFAVLTSIFKCKFNK